MSFDLSSGSIAASDLEKNLQCSFADGAIVTFKGQVRDHNRSVVALEYEAYQSLAIDEGQKIIDEAKRKFAIANAKCIHRLGGVNLLECTVWIGVTAEHRDAAFKACRYIIDEVKKRLPIWKKEIYADGLEQWVNCDHDHDLLIDMPLCDAEKQFYKSQISLPELGLQGQEKLKNSKVLLIGLGGLGNPALLYLAGTGVGTIGICDFDSVQETNLNRQTIFNFGDIGQSKTEIAKKKIAAFNPFINVVAHEEAFNELNAADLVARYDLLLDCTDNLDSKLLINNSAIKYRKPLIQASVYQYEGQLHCWFPTGSDLPKQGQCLNCLWDGQTTSITCNQSGTIGAAVGIIGGMQAMEAIKFLLGLSSPLSENIFIFDLISLENRLIKTFKRADCEICGSGKNSILPSVDEFELLISRSEQLHNFVLIDALEIASPNWESRIDHNKNYLLYCTHGIASRSRAMHLRKSGRTNIFSLKHGLRENSVVQKWLEGAYE